LAGGLQKMSNFNVLARLAPLGSLAPARCPPSLRQGFGGQATRRASAIFCARDFASSAGIIVFILL